MKEFFISILVGLAGLFGFQQTFGDSGVYDIVSYSVPNNQSTFSTDVGSWKFGSGDSTNATPTVQIYGGLVVDNTTTTNATTTGSVNVNGSRCFDGTSCIDSWAGATAGTNNWNFPTGFSSLTISPTTSVGLYITASSTVRDLRIDGNATTTGYLGVEQYIEFPEVSTQATPSANRGKLYIKDDGGDTKIYFLDPTGTETDLTGGGGGCTTLDCLSDTIITAAASNDVLQFDGSNWVDSPLNFNQLSGNATVAQGGTNITTYTLGDILYASATNVLSKLGIGTGFLRNVGGIPAWSTDVMDLTTNQTVSSGVKTFTVMPQSSAVPSANDDLVNVSYVSSFAQGLVPKQACRAATTAAGTLASDFENGDTIDGVVLATGDRLLIKNQVAQTANGIYTVNASGAPTRATDYDVSAEVQEGTFTYISSGTVNSGDQFFQTTIDPVLDTNNLVFALLNEPTAYTAGDGLDLSGTEFSTDLRADRGLQITATELDILYNNSITGNSSGLAVNTTSPFTWTGLNTWTDARPAVLNATSTTVGTFTAYSLATLNTIIGAGLTDCDGVSNALTWNSSTNLFGCNSITGGSGGGAGSGSATTTIKTANESVTSSITFQDDDELKMAVDASSRYAFRFSLLTRSATTPDMKFQVTGPTGATCIYMLQDTENAISYGSTGGTSNRATACSSSIIYVVVAATDETVEIVGSVTTSVTAGNLTLQWAQNTSNATAATVYAGSYLTMYKMGAASVFTSNWLFNSQGYLTPSTTVGVVLPANATTTGRLVLGATNPTGPSGNGDLFVGGNATTTGNFSVSTSTFIVQTGTSKEDIRVGVGTTTPLYNFSLQGASADFISTIVNTTAGGDYLTIVGDAGTPVFNFKSAGTGGEALMEMYGDNVLNVQISGELDFPTYFNSGNVGIGTTTPLTLLTLEKTTASTITLSRNDTTLNAADEIGSVDFFTNDASASGTGIMARVVGYSNSTANLFGNLGFFTASTQGVGPLTEKMTILSLGNVGIGDTSPAELFTVGSGDLFTIDSSGNASTTGYVQIGKTFGASGVTLGAGDLFVGDDTNMVGDLTVSTDSLFVDSAQNHIGIGTADPALSSGVSGAHIYNDGSISELRLTGFRASTPRTFIRGQGAAGSAASPTLAADGAEFLLIRAEGYGTTGFFESSEINFQGGTGTFSDTSIPGRIVFKTAPDGTVDATEKMRIDPSGIVVNENSADFDFRVESNGNANMLFVDAGNDSVGIGTAAPQRLLTLSKSDTSTTFGAAQTAVERFINQSATVGTMTGIQFNHVNDLDAQAMAGIYSVLTSASSEGTSDLAFGLHASISATTLTEYMRIESGGNVGIGTNNPATRLEIDTGSNTTGIRVLGTAETAEIADIFVGSTGQLSLGTANTTDSGAYIDIDPEDDLYGLILRDGNTGTFGAFPYSNFYTVDAATDYLSITVNDECSGCTGGVTALIVDDDNQVGIGTNTPDSTLHVFAAASTDPFRVATSTNSQILFIDKNGRMGFNTSTFYTDDNGFKPQVVLVGGNSGTDNFGLQLDSDEGGISSIGFSHAGDVEWYLGSRGSSGTNNNRLAFQAADGAVFDGSVFDILQSGKIGVNTTTPDSMLTINGNDGTTNLFDVSTSTRQNIFGVNKDGTAYIQNHRPGLQFTDTDTGDTDYFIATDTTDDTLSIYTGTKGGAETQALSINSSGRVIHEINTAVSTDPVCWDGSGASIHADCTSLQKWKANVKDLTLGLKTVLELKPRTFNWRRDPITHDLDESKVDPELDLGFIAEEVEKVDSLLASYSLNVETGKKELTGVKIERFVAPLVNAVQELYHNFQMLFAWNEELQIRIEILEKHNATLLKRIELLEND